MSDLTTANTVKNLERRWADTDRGILRRLFATLAAGEALDANQLATRLGLDAGAVREALAPQQISTDEEGKLSELFGYMFAPSLHRVELGGKAMFACCALVAHTLPRLLDTDLRLESVDPIGRGVVRMTLGPDGVRDVSPRRAVATFPVSPTRWTGSVRDNFCAHARHFSSSAEAEAYAARDHRRLVMDLEAIHSLAAEVSRCVWSV